MTTVAKETEAGESVLIEEVSTVLDDSRELRDQIAQRLNYLQHVNKAVDRLAACHSTEAVDHFGDPQHTAHFGTSVDHRSSRLSEKEGPREERDHNEERGPQGASVDPHTEQAAQIINEDTPRASMSNVIDRQTVVQMRNEQLAELCEKNCRIGRMRQGQARMRRDLQASHWRIKQRQEENELMQQRVSSLEEELQKCKLALSKKDALLKKAQARERQAKTASSTQEEAFLNEVSLALEQIQADQDGMRAKMLQALAVAQQNHQKLEKRATDVEDGLHKSYAEKMDRCRNIAAGLIFRNHLRYLLRIAFLAFQLYPVMRFQG